MGRTATFSQSVISMASKGIRQAKTVRELRTGLSVLIPAVCQVPNRTAAELLGVGVASIGRMQKEVRDQVRGNVEVKRQWGGRRRETMSREQEVDFLEPWAAEAATGGVLVVPPIHAALEKQVGHPVAPSTVYRMLARHGWRKVTPDTCHPKRDAAAQEEFKKGASRQHWQKL